MPRPKSPTPKIKIHLVLTQTLYAKAMILIHSPQYQRGFPQGAFSDLMERALNFYIQHLEGNPDERSVQHGDGGGLGAASPATGGSLPAPSQG